MQNRKREELGQSKDVMLWKDTEAPSLTVKEILIRTLGAIEKKVDHLMEELASKVRAASEDWQQIVNSKATISAHSNQYY